MSERAQEIQRLEKLLEYAGIKLPSVATDIIGAGTYPGSNESAGVTSNTKLTQY